MNTINKKSIKSGLIAGIVFAGITVGFDYYDGQDFRVWRFIFNFLWFGIFMGLYTRYILK